MAQEIIGRKQEMKQLALCSSSGKAEFVAVYGRRRVGKTFLIRQYFHDDFDFYITGLYKGTMKDQLRNFAEQLQSKSKGFVAIPHDWHEAFAMLRTYLEGLKKKTATIFFDELPWLDTPRSKFVQELDYFWNSWGAQQDYLKFYVCGSAATWMIKNLIGAKGGLHNRLTCSMRLLPFTLAETEQYLRSKQIEWERYTIIECYAIFGGIPYYLSQLHEDESLTQNVDRLLFSMTGMLKDEYSFVFRSLFEDYPKYYKVVELLAKKRRGMSREEIMTALKLPKGGALSDALVNLQNCDFIRKYHSFGKKQRDAIYQLTDLFTLFYHTFMANEAGGDEHAWSNMLDNPKRVAWMGYAFEQVCMLHIPQIKKALVISGMLTEASSWMGSDGVEKGQIDLVIDRRDRVVNLCEMKFSTGPFDITKAYSEKLRNRMSLFRSVTKTTKSLANTFVTTYGVKNGKYSGIVSSQATMDDLFVE